MTNSRRIFLLQAAIAVLLLFAVAVQASRVIERHVNARWQLVGSSQGGLKSSTRTWLASLSGHVSLTYFVSARSGMPSSMKGVEDEVTRLLDALRRAAPGAIDCRIVDPTLPQDSRFEPSREAPAGGARRSEPPPPPGTEYASSSRGASPVKARTVLADESNEVAVWSSLVLSHDQFTDGLIQDITAADLPYLEDLIVETLRAGAAVVQPIIAVAAPQEGYSTVRKLCASLTGARTIEANLETATALPLEADLLVWVDPHRLRPEQALALERYIATGRSVILAGSAYSIDYLPREGGKIAYRIAPSSADWASFLRPLGLTLAPAVFTDKYHDAITWRRNGGLFKVDAPFHVRVLPSLFDTRSFLGPNAGALLVSAISAIQWDARAVAAWGRRVEVVATTSENTRRTDLPAGEFDDAALAGGAAVPKQPWIVLLKPQDPWQGELLVAGSPVLFHDDPYAQGGNANQVFLRTLLRTYTAPTRLARIRVPKRLPQRLPELSLGARVGWRAFVVAAVPMGLLGAALRRARTRPLGPRKVPWVSRAALGGACLAVVLLVSRLLAGFWLPRADLTEDDINTPSALTLRLLDAVRDGLEVDLIASESFRLPPEMKPVEPRILGALRTLGLRPRVVRPEDPGRQRARQAARRRAPTVRRPVRRQRRGGFLRGLVRTPATAKRPVRDRAAARCAHDRAPRVPPLRGGAPARRDAGSRRWSPLGLAAAHARGSSRGLPAKGIHGARGLGRLQPREAPPRAVRLSRRLHQPRGARLPERDGRARLAPAPISAEVLGPVHEVPCGRGQGVRRGAALQRVAAAVPRRRLHHRLLAAATVPQLQRVLEAHRRAANR
jgi:hypothetical protein